jgi:hypothetical protein
VGVAADGAGGVVAWPIPLKSLPRTSCTVPVAASSPASVVAPGICPARVVASASSPAACRMTVCSWSLLSALPVEVTTKPAVSSAAAASAASPEVPDPL